jgi:predicted P-loop ATPase
MASRTFDTLRKPYGRVSEDVPRQFVLAMTTNEATYLKDKTGNRRFLPIKVHLDFIDINWLLENRDQLFAEAVVKYRENPTFMFPTEEAQKQQSHREEVDILFEEVEDAWNMLSDYEQTKGVTVYELWEQLERNKYGYYSKPQSWESARIIAILKGMGLEKRRRAEYEYVGQEKRQVKKTVWYEPKEQ